MTSTTKRLPRATSILDVFPIELIAEIRSHISQNDLRTNVCFHNTCPRFASVFGTRVAEQAFWEGVCLLVGLGCLPNETPKTVDWKRVALDSIDKDGFCEHPACGNTRLEGNAAWMNMMVKMDIPCWNDIDISFDEDCYFGDYKISPVSYHIGFAPRTDVFLPVIEEEDAYLQYVESMQTPPGQNRYLWDHPIAARSFAIFSLIPQMRLAWTRMPPNLINKYGVTVWDVQHSFRSIFEAPTRTEEMATILFFVDHHLVFEEECEIPDVFQAVTALRSFLTYFPWDGLTYDQWSDIGPSFDLYFKVSNKKIQRDPHRRSLRVAVDAQQE